MKKHGLCGTPLYNVWLTMKQRCYNPKDKHYKWYGFKGVKVCSEWLNNAEAFVEWALNNNYKPGLTLDRIDSNGDYTPSNCRFITIQAQQRNKSSNHVLVYDGISLPIQEWAEKLNITPSTLRSRINKGWTIDRALTTPVRRLNRL